MRPWEPSQLLSQEKSVLISHSLSPLPCISLFSVLYKTLCWECLGGGKTIAQAGCPPCGQSVGQMGLSGSTSPVAAGAVGKLHQLATPSAHVSPNKPMSLTASSPDYFFGISSIMLRFSQTLALCLAHAGKDQFK